LLKHIALALALLLVTGAAQAAEKPDFIVDSMWLEDHIDDPETVILEVRYHPHRHGTAGHIPGAVQVQRFKDLGDNDRLPVMHLPSREAFQDTLRSWGVNDDSQVVIYDDSRTALASRVYFLLELYGFDMDRVKVLEGGTIQWSAFNPTPKDPVNPERGDVTLEPADESMVVTWTEIYDDVVSRRDEDTVLLDARPEHHYSGETVAGAPRGGHIPGAVNIVSLKGTGGQSQNWRGRNVLASMYEGLPKDKTIYVYCHDSFRSTLAYMQLKFLGYEDVRLYDGGWAHWGRALSLPVVEGAEPFDEEFAL